MMMRTVVLTFVDQLLSLVAVGAALFWAARMSSSAGSPGLLLQGIGGGTVIATLRAFVRQAETEMAGEEAEKVLGKLTEGR